eukprot:6825065-Prymnesium_polylepis.3
MVLGALAQCTRAASLPHMTTEILGVGAWDVLCSHIAICVWCMKVLAAVRAGVAASQVAHAWTRGVTCLGLSRAAGDAARSGQERGERGLRAGGARSRAGEPARNRQESAGDWARARSPPSE